MRLAPLQRSMVTVLLISCFAVYGVSSWQQTYRISEKGPVQEVCPPCELLFSKLNNVGGSGKLTQEVKVQVRGEPKSGTGFMYFWATATLLRTCRYLQDLFGEESCRVELNPGEETDDLTVGRYFNRSLIFEPTMGGSYARCSCDTVDRVSIVLSKFHKHTLPVSPSCAYSHGGGMDLVMVERRLGKSACTFADGAKIENKDDLWRCMHKANCETIDDWIQMAIFRDPRPAVVSSYYHREVHGSREVGELEDFIKRELPILCQWLAIRYILFCGMIPHQSMVFWYDDAISDPLAWHYHWFHSVGLQLPPHIVQRATTEAVADNLGFRHKTIDVHPGEEPRPETSVRRFEDEVAPDIIEIADAVLRVWLPPVLLEKFGVLP